MERINIMTTCNDGIAQYILPQIASIGTNLSHYDIRFNLVHSRVSKEKVNLIREYSSFFSNITFSEIVLEDVEDYNKLTKLGGDWPPEAYYSLCCNEYLPEDIDRILYIDTGDIIIDGDIGEYYFGDFEGCSILATALRYRGIPDGMRLFTKEDLIDPSLDIMGGVFNSGSYVINVEKLRESKIKMNDFIYVAKLLWANFNPATDMFAYSGDQGLLSVSFVGDIKFFGYPEIKNVYYMPYNFCTYFFDKRDDLWYTPIVLHYVGQDFLKPWYARLSINEVEKYKFISDFVGDRAPFCLKGRHIEYFEIWWRYCQMTPIYDELNKEATIRARALESHFLPLCKQFNDLVDSLPK